MTTRIRGAHRSSDAGAGGQTDRPDHPDGADPAPSEAPRRRWALSLTVLAVVAAICAVGAYVLGGGSGGRIAAPAGSALPAASTSGAASASPSGWVAATVTPGASGAGSGSASGSPSGSPSGSASEGPSGSASGAPSGPPSDAASGSPSVPTAATGSEAGATAAAADVPQADRVAGIATRTLVERGSGSLSVVPGSVPAPTSAPRMTVRVEVEGGIGADGKAFAAFVMDTLNDPRGWSHGRALSFARTDGPADIRVVLASPDTSAALCAPEKTGGTLSCGDPGRVVVTMYRWLKAAPQWSDDVTAYRRYALNHELGHALGKANSYCDPGHLAPVMVDQTRGLYGCIRNAWPYPKL